jgi:1-acyl-sn-glycerol-3-phosphate acyltransferase
MDPNRTAIVSRRHATDDWEQQILHNIEVLEELGLNRVRAQHLVSEFVRVAHQIPTPSVLHVFDDPSVQIASDLLTEATPDGRAFMLEFLDPIMACVSVEGMQNLDALAPLLGHVPITVVSNHLSHLDAPAIFHALWHASVTGRSLAEQLVILAGRFASQTKFARPALTLFSSLLVCSPWDILESPEQSDLMGKINRRAFRQARRLQATGRVLALFPEGTRSLDGRQGPFLASLYPYLTDTVVLPIKLGNMQALLPNSGLVFKKASASIRFGKPVLVGTRPVGELAALVNSLQHIDGARGERSRQAVLDAIATLGASDL